MATFAAHHVSLSTQPNAPGGVDQMNSSDRRRVAIDANLTGDFVATASLLPLGNLHGQALQRRSHLDLARKPARGLPLRRGALQHFKLVARWWWKPVGPYRVHDDMAGGAHRRATAFGDDATHARASSGLHQAHASRRFKTLQGAVVMNEGDVWHGNVTLVSGGNQAGIWRSGRLPSGLAVRPPRRSPAPGCALRAWRGRAPHRHAARHRPVTHPVRPG